MKKTIILFATATIICATTQAQSYWSMSGNSASGTNFIGTTNNTPFRIRTNNVLRMSIDENRTGLGLSNPSANLHIHSTYIEDPGNIIEPLDRDLIGPYENTLYMTNTTTGSSSSDGFAIIQYENKVTLRQRENDDLNIYGANGKGMTIYPDGNIGIGNGGAHANMYIGSYADNATSGNASYLGFNARRNGSTWYFSGNGTNNGGALLWTDASGNLLFANVAPTGGSAQQVLASNMHNNVNLILYNDGLLQAKEVKVTLSGWPDYVFGEDYKLISLGETEQFIKENGHLPGVPSAQEVEERGLSLGEMNARLMQKVEELTLHVIELQKQIDELKKSK